MRNILALALTFALALAQLPASLAAQAQTTGTVTGKAQSNTGRNLSGITVRVRSVTGAIIGSTVTKNDGAFSIGGMTAGAYTLECLQKDQVIGTANLNLTLPTTTQDITCASDVAGLPILNKKALTALGAAAVAIGALAIVSTQGDGSPAR